MKIKLFSQVITLILLISVNHISSPSYAQSRSHSNWIFGTRCSLSWDLQNQITTGTNAQIDTYEGVATFSDPVSGDLLLYSDGRTAWNRQNQVISSQALGGDPSAAQSAIIVPAPGLVDHYYIFTQPARQGNLQYTLFDMSVGGVQIGSPSTAPNTVSSSETVGATPHRNGRDFWIITTDGGANTLIVFLLSPDGLSSANVYQQNNIGSLPINLGQIVFSSDSRSLLIAGRGLNMWDFNNATGEPSAQNTIPVPSPSVSTVGGGINPYGVALSSDDSKLYVQLYRPSPTVYQYDLEQNFSRVELGYSTSCGYGGGLSLAVDGKIYMGCYGDGAPQPYVGVIESPNEGGVAAGFDPQGVTMSGCTVHYGLPTAISAFTELVADFDDDDIADVNDPDSDNDGISDIQELGGVDLSTDQNQNGVADYEDAFLRDCDDLSPLDGFCDILDPLFDIDGDGIANHLDIDSDNDGITDLAECLGQEVDANLDGAMDVFIDEDDDGISVLVDVDDQDAEVRALFPTVCDTDDDGILNPYDLDSDGDGHFDLVEGGGIDTDNNGQVDPTGEEDQDTDSNGLWSSVDPNEGGISLLLPDSDGDGISDVLERCADSRLTAPETCDDGDEVGGDGCSALCELELGWRCQGEPSVCDIVCGDGIIIGDESCDDGNLINNDGCSAICTTENRWLCLGEPSSCIGVCGDGVTIGDEGCDDGNTNNEDGCSDACLIEQGWRCEGDLSACSPICGDEILLASESCDDGNLVAGDGCDATCQEELGWTCEGSGGLSCTPVCGDGVLRATESCDDRNLLADDGCDEDCAIEDGWGCQGEPSRCNGLCGDGLLRDQEECDDGGLFAGDGCNETCQIEIGWRCLDGVNCRAICGDGMIFGDESCDDGNLRSNDGCDEQCFVEDAWLCQGAPSLCDGICGDRRVRGLETCDDGGLEDADGCSSMCRIEEGWGCANLISCQPICGDRQVYGDETCDDGNLEGGDGCSSTCGVENGWQCDVNLMTCESLCGDGLVRGTEECDDGALNGGDGCSEQCELEDGWRCDHEPTICDSICGDGLLMGDEVCDDGNRLNFDGCNSLCQLESGWRCEGSPSECQATCGDGLRASTESCDDGNLDSNDGCNASCSVEPGWECDESGGRCRPECGDGIKIDSEECDDSNLLANDGCSRSCGIEEGWRCDGSPSLCISICGDGLLQGAETCDDGNVMPGDGCSDNCEVDIGYRCAFTSMEQRLMVCESVCGDGYVREEACDDGNLIAGDGCNLRCDIEDAYVCEGEPSICRDLSTRNFAGGSFQTSHCDQSSHGHSLFFLLLTMLGSLAYKRQRMTVARHL